MFYVLFYLPIFFFFFFFLSIEKHFFFKCNEAKKNTNRLLGIEKLSQDIGACINSHLQARNTFLAHAIALMSMQCNNVPSTHGSSTPLRSTNDFIS